MKLELGKTYLTRDGRKMKVINVDEGVWKPVVAKNEHDKWLTYTMDGKLDPTNREPQCGDLVAEYIPEETKMKLEVGKKYLTKSGHTVEILKGDVCDEYLTNHPCFIGHMIEMSVVRYWDKDGKHLHGAPEYDIWKEKKPEPDPPKIVLKFGRKYKTRDGSIAEIRSMNGREPYVAIGYCDQAGHGPVSWTINGGYGCLNHDLDIVEEL